MITVGDHHFSFYTDVLGPKIGCGISLFPDKGPKKWHSFSQGVAVFIAHIMRAVLKLRKADNGRALL